MSGETVLIPMALNPLGALGILAATVANHLLAATLGTLVGDWLTPDVLRAILVVSFLAMAAWTMMPDRLDGPPKLFDRFGAFGATAISFFLIEMGVCVEIHGSSCR